MKIINTVLFFLLFLSKLYSTEFITIWKSDNPGSSDDQTIEIPFYGTNYYMEVRDVNTGALILETVRSGPTTLHLPYAGSFEISVGLSGNFHRIDMSQSGDKKKLISIEQWGNTIWSSMENAFRGCTNLINNATDKPILSNVTSSANMFRFCSLYTDNINSWNVSEIEDMNSMFLSATSFNSPLNNWNVSKVKHMDNMFRNAEAFDGNISTWQTDSLITMEGMFREATIFNQDLAGWNVSKVTNMDDLFNNAIAFDQSLANWDVSLVSTMDDALNNTSISLLNYDETLIAWSNLSVQSGVTIGADGLPYCNGLNARNSLINQGWVFVNDVFSYDCLDGRMITIWDPGNVENTRIRIFATGTNYDIYYEEIGNETNRAHIKGNNGETVITGLSNTSNYKLYIGGGDPAFSRIHFNNNIHGRDLIEIVDWGDIPWSSMLNAFYGCSNLTTLPVSNYPDLSSVTSAQNMFRGCSKLIANINEWDVSNIENMRHMFLGCSVFNSKLIEWDVSQVTDMAGMFQEASVFNKSLNIWNVSKVTKMGRLFKDAANFNGLINNWNTENVESMESMFSGATNFNRNIGSWDVSKVIFMNSTFLGAESFNHSLSSWNTVSATTMTNMFSGATAFDHPIDNFTLTNVNNLTGMLDNCGISTMNYDSTLIGWSTTMLPMNKSLGAASLTYCDGEDARNSIIQTYNWTITGDSKDIFQKWFYDNDNDGYGDSTSFVFACVQPDNYVLDSVDCDDNLFDIDNICRYERFATTWKTNNAGNSANDEITLQITGSNYHVFWENLANPNIKGSSIESGTTTIEFPTAGTYRVYLSEELGNIERFEAGDDHDKLLSIDNWGEITWTSMQEAFLDCSKMTYNALDEPDLKKVTSLQKMFSGCTLFNGNINSWEVDSIKNMASLFNGAINFNSPLDNWDVSKVTNMTNMFNQAQLFDQDISNWNTSSLLFSTGSFNNAFAFNQDLSQWDVSALLNATSMFDNAGIDHVNLDAILQGWYDQDLNSNVPFGLEGLDYCKGIYAYDSLQSVNNWNISGGNFIDTCMDDAFITTWQTNTSNNGRRINLYGSGLNYNIVYRKDDNSHITAVKGSGNTTITFPSQGLYYVYIYGGSPAFHRITNNNQQYLEKLIEVINWGDITWSSMLNAFYGCTNLQSVPSTSPDLSAATTMQNMFRSCPTLNSDINTWDVSNIENMRNLFLGCSIFNSPLNNWNTSQVTDMAGMFQNASKFNQNLNSWDVSQVTKMGSLFKNASVFNGLISNWNTSQVQSMGSMFSGASGFDQDIGQWNVSDVIFMNNTFLNASKFNQNLDGWNTSSVTTMQNMFSGASKFNQSLDSFNLINIVNISGMLNNSGLSTTNYDSTLIAWETMGVPINMTLGASDLTYCNAEAERNNLINNLNWTISGDSKAIGQKWFLDNDMDGYGDSTSFVYSCVIPPGYTADSLDCNDQIFNSLNICTNNDFITTWNTSNNGLTENNEIQLEIIGSNIRIYWEKQNDRTINGLQYANGTTIIQFPDPNIYQIFISEEEGEISRFYFSENSDNEKLISIDQWGNIEWNSLASSFEGCTNMVYNAIDNPNLKHVKSLVKTFKDCVLFNANINGWEVDSITNISNLFQNATSFNSPLNNWNVSNVQFMINTFNNSASFNQSLAEWNMTSTLNATNMLSSCGIDIDNYDATLAGWTEQNLPMNINFGSQNLLYCKGIHDFQILQDTFSWNISGGSFDDACMDDSFITKWQTTIGTLGKVIQIYGSGVDYYIVYKRDDNTNITALKGSNTTKITFPESGNYIVYIYGGLPAFHRINFNQQTHSNKLIEVINWGDIAWSSMKNAFNGCSNLVKVPKNISPDLSSVLNCENMFHGCTSFNQLINGWDISQVQEMKGMFENATSFNNSLNNWNTISVNTMQNMFSGAISFNQSLDSFDISSVTNLTGMLDNTNLSVSNYDKTLISWSNQNPESNLILGASNLNFCTAGAAKEILETNYNWTITDNGSISKVNNTNDSGEGSLRHILSNSCSAEITFDSSLENDTIKLMTEVLSIDQNKTIQGTENNIITIDGQNQIPIFQVNLGDTLILKDLQLINGFQQTFGGAIINNGTVIINNTIFKNNKEGLSPKAWTNNGQVIIEENSEVIIKE